MVVGDGLNPRHRGEPVASSSSAASPSRSSNNSARFVSRHMIDRGMRRGGSVGAQGGGSARAAVVTSKMMASMSFVSSSLVPKSTPTKSG